MTNQITDGMTGASAPYNRLHLSIEESSLSETLHFLLSQAEITARDLRNMMENLLPMEPRLSRLEVQGETTEALLVEVKELNEQTQRLASDLMMNPENPNARPPLFYDRLRLAEAMTPINPNEARAMIVALNVELENASRATSAGRNTDGTAGGLSRSSFASPATDPTPSAPNSMTRMETASPNSGTSSGGSKSQVDPSTLSFSALSAILLRLTGSGKFEEANPGLTALAEKLAAEWFFGFQNELAIRQAFSAGVRVGAVLQENPVFLGVKT